jgi:hypothetical protein
MLQQEDISFDEGQMAVINRLISEGVDEHEAKIRVLCIGAPPDHFKSIKIPYQAYPKMMYHADGRNQVCNSAADEEIAKENGWADSPARVHLDKFQNPSAEVVEHKGCPSCGAYEIGRFCPECGVDKSASFSVPAGVTAAAGKQKKASAAK